MDLPPTVKIEDVQGGKQVVIVNPITGDVFKRFDTVYSSPFDDYKAMNEFLVNGIANGFDLND